MAYKVTLRKKKISGGRLSLYLDYYPAIPHPETGEPTRRKFLGLYILEKPKTPLEKEDNKEVLRIAEARCANAKNALNKSEIYTEFEKERLNQIERGKEDFVEYYLRLAKKKQGTSHDNWVSAGNYLERFTGGSIAFKDVNQRFCEDFKEYLLSTKSVKSDKAKLSQNSAVSYFNKFRTALKVAYKEGYFKENLRDKVDAIPYIEPHREYLTLDELKKLYETPCNNKLYKRVALFAAMTGLRFSDIQKLKWSEVYTDEDGQTHLNFRQKKTKSIEMHPINGDAVILMGDRKGSNEPVFEGLKYSAYHNKDLYHWIGLAGIQKNIKFHCFRHTYAMLQIENGTDVFLLSKLLGHKSVKTTQIYAKNADKRKREAANKINLGIQNDTI